MSVQLRWGSASDVGRVRSNNQDARVTTDRVLAVADGMGGHRGGEVASQVALEILQVGFTEPSPEGLRDAAYVANQAVFRRAADDPDLRGMGTTLVALARVEDDTGHETLAWINIGDSRLYLLRDGELGQVSEDHSLVEEMVRDGRISPDEARGHPQRNILTRALGIDPAASIDVGTIDPFLGDRYLLCSDGLFNEVDEPRIASTLRRLDDPDDAAKELVRLALDGGGRDNITVVIADVVDDGGVSSAASERITGDTSEGHADLAGFTAPVKEPDRTDADAEPEAEADEDRAPTRAEKRKHKAAGPRLLTLRLGLFVVLLVVIVGAVLFAFVHQARTGYTVKRVDGRVLIYEGNGDKVLWFDSQVKEDLGTLTIAPRDESAVNEGRHFDSLSAAHDYVDTLRRDAESVGPAATTTTTSTTTTTPAATTTTAPLAPIN